MITYKAAQYGIKVYVTEESYTSKASFLDDDDIPTMVKVMVRNILWKTN